MAEGPGFVQPRAEQAEGRPHGGLQLSHRGAEGQALSSALWGQRQDPREWHGAGTGEGQAGVRERFCTQRVVGHWDRLPRDVDTALRLPEFKKHLDSALRHVVWFLGGPVWSQKLD